MYYVYTIFIYVYNHCGNVMTDPSLIFYQKLFKKHFKHSQFIWSSSMKPFHFKNFVVSEVNGSLIVRDQMSGKNRNRSLLPTQVPTDFDEWWRMRDASRFMVQHNSSTIWQFWPLFLDSWIQLHSLLTTDIRTQFQISQMIIRCAWCMSFNSCNSEMSKFFVNPISLICFRIGCAFIFVSL